MIDTVTIGNGIYNLLNLDNEANNVVYQEILKKQKKLETEYTKLQDTLQNKNNTLDEEQSKLKNYQSKKLSNNDQRAKELINSNINRLNKEIATLKKELNNFNLPTIDEAD